MDVEQDTMVQRLGQRNLTLMLQSLTDVKQSRVAEVMGIPQSSLSDFKREHLERLCLMAAVCGLKFVDATSQTIDEDHINALEVLAARALRRGRRSNGAGGD